MKKQESHFQGWMKIETIHSYRPEPDFELEISEEGRVVYTGRFYVGQPGRQEHSLSPQRLKAIRLFQYKLISRNGNNHLKSIKQPVFEVSIGEGEPFLIDKTDFLSLDYLDQIFEAADVLKWIDARMNLFLVMNRPLQKSKMMALIMAGSPELAVKIFVDQQQKRIDSHELFSLHIGERKENHADHPGVFFTFLGNQSHPKKSGLVLNQGPLLQNDPLHLFLFISAGKRYNDPTGSYFLGLGQSANHTLEIFKKTYPHFR